MQTNERLHGVEALRGLAAISVTLFHLTNGNAAFLPDDHPVKIVGSYGYLGVELFFVISGFIISVSLLARGYRLGQDSISFLVRRILRIEPPFLASIAVVVLLQVASASTPSSQAKFPDHDVWTSVLFHVAYLAPWFDKAWLSPVYWSLAIEFQFYLAMIVLAPMLLSRSATGSRAVLLLILVAPTVNADPRGIFPYLPLFGLGLIAFCGYTGRIRPIEDAAWTAAFGAAAIGTLGWSIAIAGIASRILLSIPVNSRIPVLSWLGTISFSLYLVHVPIGGRVINLSLRLTETPVGRLGALIVALGASLVAAWIFWHLVERPSQRWAARTFGPGRRGGYEAAQSV